MRKAQLLSLIFILIVSTAFADSFNAVRELIHHADTYLWLGMNEDGDMKDYSRGLELLAAAEELIDDDIPLADREGLSSEIEALRNDFIEQADMTHDTLGGVFPVSRLLGPPVLLDAGTNGSYEIIDDAYIIAHCSAVETGLPMVNSVGTIKSQAGAVVFSDNRDVALENEAAYILNQSPSFYLHTKRELLELFSENDIERMRTGNLSASEWSEMISTLGDSHLIVLSFKQTDQVDDVYFYSAFFKIYEASSGTLTKQYSTMGFARDRTPSFIYICITDLILILAAVLLFILINKQSLGRSDGTGSLIGAGIVLYAAGRFIPYIFASLMSPLYPAPDTLAVLSFWWPVAAGLLSLLGPIFIYFALSSRISRLSPALSFAGRGGSIFLTIGIGTAGFLASPVLIYEGISGFYRLIPLVLNTAASTYILGRALDSKDKTAGRFTAVSVTGLLVVSTIFSLQNSIVFFTAAGLIFIILAAASAMLLKDSGISEESVSEFAEPEDLSASAESLIARLSGHNPADIVPSPVLKQMTEYLTSDNSANRSLLMTGPEGRGKTIYSHALAQEVSKETKSGPPPLVLKGACQESAAAESFFLFERAFSGHNALSALINTDDRIERTAQSLEEIAGSLLPIPLELLFPEGVEGPPKTAAEIYKAIHILIRRIAKKRAVIMILEDLHFIDPDSRELLTYLLDNLNMDDRFYIICNSENDALFSGAENRAKAIFEIPSAGTAEKTAFLTQKLGIAPASAGILLEASRIQNGNDGEMGDFVRMLVFFAREDLFSLENEMFKLKKAYSDPEQLPVQPDVIEEIRTRMEQFPQYEKLLGCAACFGREFLADTIASSLHLSRMETLDILDRIESDTGFIYDIRETDDCYAFSSGHIFKAIREEMEISESGPMQNNVPQIVREYHRRLAETLVLQWEKTKAPDIVPEIARHFYASGISNARRAWDFCIKTVELSMDSYMFRQAFTYLEYAAECSRVLAEPGKKAVQILELYLKNAHLSGLNRNEAAERGWRYLAENREADNALKLNVARAYYDNAVSGKREYFERCFSTAEEIIKSGEKGRNRAEALQFMGLAAEPGDPRRRDYLQEALGLLEIEDDSLEVLAVRARVLDSLGRDIMYENPARAEKCFRDSLEIKESPNAFDRPGQAISYGALGNLYHFVHKDLEKAIGFYEKDLELSVEISDVIGQTKMHSLIAGCLEGLGRFTEAADEYSESMRICGENGSPIDRFFASAGLMLCAAKGGMEPAEVKQINSDFTELLSDPAVNMLIRPGDKRAGFLAERLAEVVSAMEEESFLKEAAAGIRENYSV